ncbi:MAG: hypothetical protein KDC98_01930 [Planctomycetes bacterium]|nr:hypothetical protein [Planctomycetota bacterium]
MTNPTRVLGLLPCLLALADPAQAQWSSTSAANLAIGDGAGDQVQAKVVPTADGGCYISWFDSDPNGSPAFGYDVRLQRLDAGGHELWPHRGILVADRGFSSTQDYGLDVDLFDHALLTFRDDRFGGTQITAARVDPAGTLVWGSNGVQLTNTTAFVAVPKICGTSDGNCVVAWTENADVQVQKLDPAGTAVWAANVVLSAAGSNLASSDLHAADAGGAILALQQSGSFTSPRHLLAQKLDIGGNLLWGPAHLAVFDNGSLQFGNYPRFVVDGSGGAVFGWYSSTPALECRAQHVDAAGVEQFAHNGVSASTGPGDRVNPGVAFDPATQTTFLAYVEQSGGQYRIAAQSFDAIGNRQWSPTGAPITTYGAAAVADVNALAIAGMMAFWTEEPGFAQDRVYGARLDAAGTTVVPRFAVSSTPAVKYRIAAAASSLGYAILLWQDQGSGTSDILAQNALPNGSLGGVASFASRNGTGLNPVCFTTTERPALGTTWHGDVAHSATTIATGMVVDFTATTGPVLPGVGELLVPFPAAYSAVRFSSGSSDQHTLLLPGDLAFVGFLFAAQAATLDGAGAHACNALDLRLGL